MHKGTILSIDDDQGLQTVLKEYFKHDGFEFIQAYDAFSAAEKLETNSFNLILLDLSLPDGEGLDLLKRFKSKTDAAIIVISGNTDTMEKIICLEMGADDYLVKPFELRELSARIKAKLRQIKTNSDLEKLSVPEEEILEFGDGWCLDRAKYQLYNKKNQPIDITPGQFKLLETLVRTPNRVLSREHLFELTRDGEFEAYDRAIDIQVARLRRKLNDNKKPSMLIKTVRGVGYMFCGETRVSSSLN